MAQALRSSISIVGSSLLRRCAAGGCGSVGVSGVSGTGDVGDTTSVLMGSSSLEALVELRRCEGDRVSVGLDWFEYQCCLSCIVTS